MANLSAKIRLAAMVVTLLAISSTVQGTTIDVRSQCSFTLTACDQAQGTGVSCFVLRNGDSHPLNVTVWAGGVIWGYPGNDTSQGNLAKPEATLAEFTIGFNGQDFYDLSIVKAYNLPLEIHPTFIGGGGQVSGPHCGSPSCTIPNLNSFCPPNKLTGPPGDGCYYFVDTVPTGPQPFPKACPTAYSGDNSKTYTCNLGSNYEVVFCP